MIPIFYTPPEKIQSENEELIISGEEAHHIRNVFRLGKGDTILVVDGIGNGYKVEIERISDKGVNCRIFSRIRNFGEPVHFVTLVAGLSTGTKFDEVIQRGTELGVSRFIPMVTEKSKVKADEGTSGKNRYSRWQKIALASIKQAGRSVLPHIEPITNFDRVFNTVNNLGKMLLFDPSEGGRHLNKIQLGTDDRNCTIFIGPEAGFTKSELHIAEENGAHIISLGQRVLRTENAAPIAAALLMNLLGELR
ncbi:MAG: RsmE family RNA methyltransferase [candidate division Zixibacteria bacterium]|nr:RsmE family RNA methyltransferase [candidate division Zixibacteria bacterium]